MATKARPKKYGQVEIQFNNDIPEAVEGTVLVRDEEMVIDIHDEEGKTQFLIVGKPVKHFFQGVDSSGVGTSKVSARWASLGTVFVGQWVQDGQEYLFSFELND